MRTDEWLATRVARARARILAALENRRLGFDTLLEALGEITDDPPNDSAAMLLAEAMGCLPSAAYEYLLQDVQRHATNAARQLEQQALAHLRSQGTSPEVESTIGDCRANPSPQGSFLVPLAVTLQALFWAVIPPEERARLVY